MPVSPRLSFAERTGKAGGVAPPSPFWVDRTVSSNHAARAVLMVNELHMHVVLTGNTSGNMRFDSACCYSVRHTTALQTVVLPWWASRVSVLYLILVPAWDLN